MSFLRRRRRPVLCVLHPHLSDGKPAASQAEGAHPVLEADLATAGALGDDGLKPQVLPLAPDAFARGRHLPLGHSHAQPAVQGLLRQGVCLEAGSKQGGVRPQVWRRRSRDAAFGQGRCHQWSPPVKGVRNNRSRRQRAVAAGHAEQRHRRALVMPTPSLPKARRRDTSMSAPGPQHRGAGGRKSSSSAGQHGGEGPAVHAGAHAVGQPSSEAAR